MNFKSSFRFQAEYKTVLDYATANSITKPNSFVRQAQNRLMQGLVDSTSYSSSDRIYVLAGDGASKDFSFINWKSPGTDTLTEHGTLTYSTGGLTGNGSTGYLNSHFNPSTDGSNFTQNSAGISVYTPSYLAAEDRAIFGLRNSANTSQVTAIMRSSSTSNTTLFTMNDNTNSNYASSVMTQGMYFFKRTASNTKVVTRRLVGSGALTQNSVAIPNGDLYFLARNSLNTTTVDLFSNATLSFIRIGSPLTSDGETILTNDVTSYYRQCILPEFYVTSVNTGEKVLYQSTGSGWDGGSIFGFARYTGGGHDFELYGGTTDSSSDPVGYSVGAFDFSSNVAGTKDAGNPLIDIASYPTLDSIFPMSRLVIGSTIYWFFTVRLDGVLTHDTYVATSSTSSPKTIGTLTALLTAGSTGHFWHGFRIIETHPDTTYWYALVSNRTSAVATFTMECYRCLRANDITNGANWSSFASNIITSPSNVDSSANVAPVYNYCYYDGSQYRLLYGRFFDARKADSFTIYESKAASIGTGTFPIGKECLWPTGSLDTAETDAGYTSSPYLLELTSNTGLFYYGARKGDSSAPYIARNVKQYYIRS